MSQETISKGWQALIMVIGTTRFFLFSDFYLLYEFAIQPFFKPKKFKLPAPEIIAIGVLLVVVSVYSPRPVDGLQTAFRVILLATVLPAYKYGFHYKRVLAVSLFVLALIVSAQAAYTLRPDGLHMNALLLAESAFVFLPVFWYEVGLAASLIIIMSLSRTPLIAFIIFAVLSRRKYFIGLAFITTMMFIVYSGVASPDRLSFGGVDSALVRRVETVTGIEPETIDEIYDDKCGEYRAVEYRQFGYGLYGYCAETGQPRPHNIFVLTFYEFGVFFLPFWGLIFYAARRLSLTQVLPLLALGMVSDSLIGRPEGVYLIAAWIISIQLMKNKTPNAHPVNTLDNRGDYRVE